MRKFLRESSKLKYFVGTAMLFVAAVLILSVGVLASEAKNEISSVTLNKSLTDIVLEIHLTKEYVKENKSSTLYLFEVLPHQSTTEINHSEPVKSFKTSEKITVKIPYISGNANRLYSKFVVAEMIADGSYNIITDAKYIENISVLAENNEPFPTGSSKKGLQVQMFSDAQQLGVQHTVVNVAINEYMLGENSPAAQSFHYNGQTFYLDKNKIAMLDHRVKTYTEAGINVYFNIILTAPAADAHPNIMSFYYDGISPTASLFALNTRNETAMKAFRAFMDYICMRYTTPEHTCGMVPGIILGFEVNSGDVWNNAGTTDMASYVYSYCTAFRVAYTAMRSHYSEGRVYISLGNNFSAGSADMRDYPAKQFLSTFNTAIKSSGDIEWGLSINPYPSAAELADFWNDTLAEDNFETPYITMKNIDTLTRYMNQAEYLYNSETRSIIIGEFGIPGDSSDDASMTIQAAAYALAYYRAVQNEDIDAFIYHRHVDHSGEMQNYGLWSGAVGSVVEPAAKKPIYNVFSLIDTEQSEAVTSFVRSTVGSGAFGMFVDSETKYKEFNERTVFSAVRAEASDYAKGYSFRKLFDLTGGTLCNFYPSDGAEYVELRPFEDGTETMLYARITDIPTEYKGISNSIGDDTVFEDVHYVKLRVMAAAPTEVNSLSLLLRLGQIGTNEADAVVYEGEIQVKPGEWNEISFNIKEFTKLTEGNVDFIKLLIRTSDSLPTSGEYGIWLENISIYAKGGMSFIGWVFTILLILILIAAAGYGALYLRAFLIRKKRREEAARRKREQLRAMAMQQSRGMYPPPYSRQPQNRSDGNYTDKDL